MNNGPYARISILRPHDGDTVDFEAAYIRHLGWHREAKDPWTWYGWTIWAGERQRWLVYATFGHSAAELDNPVAPAEDEKDNVLNVIRHGQFLGHALCEFLPALSRGSGVPTTAARVELTTVDVHPAAEKKFEAAIGASQPSLQNEALWFRVIAGGPAPRYLRLCPRPNLTAFLETRHEAALPDAVAALISKTTVEILNLRPTMSYGLAENR